MATINRRAYVANRIDITWDNTYRVGAVQSAEIQISFALEPISGVGSVRVIEYIPTLNRVTVNTDMVYMFSEELDRISNGRVIPSQAVQSLQGWVFDITAARESADSPSSPGFDTRYQTLWTAQDCSMDSGSFRIAKHGAIGRAAQFMALDFRLADNEGAYSPSSPVSGENF